MKTYGNALLAVGSKGSLDKVINNDIKTKIIISSGIKQETQSDGRVKTTFGETIQGNKNAADSYGAKVNDDGTYGIKEATITIFNGSIEKGVKAGSGSKLEGLTQTQAIGAVATHENVHASDKDEINKDLHYAVANPHDKDGRPDKEVKPNNAEKKVLNKL
ncbi:hypothetical protein [Pedobacter gandavensis]|uniref:hypothetical protein n=1 Tax=Pedobacter gandavensis TaxID=2679963 RepID=UPI00292DF687|nr:hypothetical protein [Pedobacter gandavensis]